MSLQDSLVVIPARGGSVGIKNKNLQLVHGLSLVQRTFTHAKYLSDGVMPICISTDSLEILNSLDLKFKLNIDFLILSENSLTTHGSIYVHFREKRKASSSTLITENLFDIFSLFRDQGYSFSKAILMQPTSPFRSRSELSEIRKFLIENSDEKVSFISVSRVEDCHPARMYSQIREGRAKPIKGFRSHYYKRRQDLPPVFIRDGGIYIIGARLIERRIQYSNKPRVYTRQYPWSINIDSELDLLQAQNVPWELIAHDPATSD